MFQSLFLWNSLNGRAAHPVLAGAHGESFNPCFCGIRSTAELERRRRRGSKIELQSLFLWNSLNGLRPAVAVAKMPAGRFQSLFLWNSLNGPPSGGASTGQSGGCIFLSILVFVESLNSRGTAGEDGGSTVEAVSILVFVEFARRPAIAD